MNSIRSALVVLAGGTLVSRLGTFVSAMLLMRELGPLRFGEYATAVQIGTLLGIVLHSGIQAVAMREAAASPADAAGWIRAAIRARLLVSVAALAVALPLVPWVPLDPTLLRLCLALVIPAALDLTGFADAVGRTSLDVALDMTAGLVNLALVAAMVATDSVTPVRVAEAYLLARTVYAIGVALRLRSLGAPTVRPSIRRLVFHSSGPVSIAYAAETLTLASDLILIRWLAGPVEAGLFAAAGKIAQLAGLPMALLGRVMGPHLQHSVPHGNAGSTLRIALRASAYMVFPIAAGGWILAGDLLARISGADYAAAAWTLRWLLAASLLSAVAGRLSDMLFAHRRMRAYVVPIFASVAVNWTASLMLIPRLGATGSALGTAAAFATRLPTAHVMLRRVMGYDLAAALVRPTAVAALVAGAAWAVPQEWGVLTRVAAGAIVGASAVALLEFRGGWNRIGAGLDAASGLQASRESARAQRPAQSDSTGTPT